jgi:hypothetical protein
MKILRMRFEVRGQILDAGGKQGNLHLRRTGIPFMFGMGVHHGPFLFHIHHHSAILQGWEA